MSLILMPCYRTYDSAAPKQNTAQVSHPCHLSVCHPAVVKVDTLFIEKQVPFATCFGFYTSHQLAKQLHIRENPLYRITRISVAIWQ